MPSNEWCVSTSDKPHTHFPDLAAAALYAIHTARPDQVVQLTAPTGASWVLMGIGPNVRRVIVNSHRGAHGD